MEMVSIWSRIAQIVESGAGDKGEREDSDVVFLPEYLRGLGDSFGGLCAEGGGAVKAEKCAGFIASFYHAVGDEGELLAETGGVHLPRVGVNGTGRKVLRAWRGQAQERDKHHKPGAGEQAVVWHGPNYIVGKGKCREMR